MQVVATMAGTVLSIVVQVGDSVTAGQDVVVLESMKMEVPVQTDFGGKVVTVHVGVGDFVNEGDAVVDVSE